MGDIRRKVVRGWESLTPYGKKLFAEKVTCDESVCDKCKSECSVS